MVPTQVFDGVVTLSIRVMDWSFNHADAEGASTRKVLIDIVHAHANEVSDTSRIGGKLLAAGFGDDYGAIGTDGKLRTMRIADANAFTEAKSSAEPGDRSTYVRVDEDGHNSC